MIKQHLMRAGWIKRKLLKSHLIFAPLLAFSLLSGCQSRQPAITPPDFGPNVLIFTPQMAAEEIQRKVDAIYQQQMANQFGAQRYTLMFMPGRYQTTVRTGFYTQVLGLGETPDAVTLNGGLYVDAQWHQGDATQNFWRGAENLHIVPTGGTMQWAVSQASPLRRLHIAGNLLLDDQRGWSSGGFLADSVIDHTVDSGTQQQWFSRNSHWGVWVGARWNMVFVGSHPAPPSADWPTPPNSVVSHTPVVREKPYLRVNAQQQFEVFLPALRHQSQGPSWQHQTTAGRAIEINAFYIAKPQTDNAHTLNLALAQGKHLLFTPGIYHLNQALQVTRPNTIILGLGLATLTPTQGNAVLNIADVDGVVVAGLLIDAAERTSDVLMQVGTANSHLRHSANPTSLHDVYLRIGGAGVANAKVALVIDSADVIGDNLWIWRADHGTGVGWAVNRTQHGLIVNGEAVIMYGLFVEHFHQYQTIWNGNHGQVYFYQSEAPYEVPTQADWMNGRVQGFASYKVADHVTHHQALGLGIYCWFDDNPQVKLYSAIEAPVTHGVTIAHMTTVSLGGKGEITHVINNSGDKADDKNNVVQLKSLK